MNDEFENEIWESCLKAAVIENSTENEDNLSDDEISQTSLPKHYDLKMHKLIRKYHNRSRLKSAAKYGLKTACAVFTAMGIGFAVFMQSNEIRSACKTVITHTFVQYAQFGFLPDKSKDISADRETALNYVPKGFTLMQSDSDEIKQELLYTNETGGIIHLRVYFQNFTVEIDNEHYLNGEIQINGIHGAYFETQDKAFSSVNYIMWNTETEYYILTSSLDLEEMKKIAENVTVPA